MRCFLDKARSQDPAGQKFLLNLELLILMGYQWDINGILMGYQWQLSHFGTCQNCIKLSNSVVLEPWKAMSTDQRDSVIIMIDEREELIMQLCWCQLLCSFYLLLSQFRSLSGTAKHSLLESSFNIKQNAFYRSRHFVPPGDLGGACTLEPGLDLCPIRRATTYCPCQHTDSSWFIWVITSTTKIHQVQLRHHKSRLWHQINRGKPEVFSAGEIFDIHGISWHPLVPWASHSMTRWCQVMPGDRQFAICYWPELRCNLGEEILVMAHLGSNLEQTWALDGPWWPLIALDSPWPLHVLALAISCYDISLAARGKHRNTPCKCHWESMTTAPWNSLIASTKASMVSMSRWFVGSSK